jgi:type II secretory pathway pseudopilin PulG
MRAAVVRLRARAVATTSADSGISMIEVLVAMSVFVLVSASFLSALTVGFGMSRSNRARVVATNLAASDLDQVRHGRYDRVLSATYATTVGNDRYTVVRTVRPQLANSAAGPCTGGTGIREVYKKVTVKVDWSNRRYAQQVRSDTIVRTPNLESVVGSGALGVAVTDAAGRPVAGITAGVNATTLPTDEDGCAYFSPLAAASYQVALTAPGYVDRDETGLGRAVAVTADQITLAEFGIDRAATLTLDPQVTGPGGVPEAGFADPAGMVMWLKNPSNSIAQRTLTTAGSPVVALNVFPVMHTASAGACRDGDRYGPGSLASSTPAPGAEATVQVPLAGVVLTAGSGSTYPGGTLTAVRQSDSTCAVPPAETVTLGRLAAGAGASLRVGLPYGSWAITFTPASGTATTTAVYTVMPNQAPVAIPVVSP